MHEYRDVLMPLALELKIPALPRNVPVRDLSEANRARLVEFAARAGVIAQRDFLAPDTHRILSQSAHTLVDGILMADSSVE